MLLRLLSVFLLLACSPSEPQIDKASSQIVTAPLAGEEEQNSIIDPSEKTIATRILPPAGFVRSAVAKNSFGFYLRNFPVKAHGSPVLLFDGQKKYNQNSHVAVLDIDIGKRDLQQCADAVMRLRAEYLWQQKEYNKIHFNFTNGFPATYSRWRSGNRIQVKGNSVNWVTTQRESTSYAAFRKYLTMVFSYAGTLSLDKELYAKPLGKIEIGDVFIRGGSPGHAVLVVDKAVHPSTGEALILLAQSYMPAQDIHVLQNPSNDRNNPWYSIKEMSEQVRTPEWTFNSNELKAF